MTPIEAKKSLYTLLFIVVLSCAGIALPYPILAPLFLNEVNAFTHFGGFPPKLLLGVILAIYPLGVLIGSSFIGAASDIFGRRKVLIITLIFSAVGYLFSVWALLSQNYLLFLFTRFITGVSEGNIAIAKAIAIDLSPPLDKTRNYSLVSATTYGGWLLGPLIGGFLQPFGAHLAFLVAAVAMCLAIVVVYYFLIESNSEINSKTKVESNSIKQMLYQHNSFVLLKQKPIRQLFYVFLFSTLATNAFYEFYPIWLVEEFNFSGPFIGIITAVLTTSMIISSVYFITRLNQKYGLINASITAMFGFALLMLMHYFFNASISWPVYVLIGILIAVYNAMLPIFASEKFSNVSQGKLMGLITTTFSLSNVIMAIVGSVISLYGSVYSIMFGGILMVVAIILLTIFRKQHVH